MNGRTDMVLQDEKDCIDRCEYCGETEEYCPHKQYGDIELVMVVRDD